METNSYAELKFDGYPSSYINRNLKSSIDPSFDAFKTAVNSVSERVPVMGVEANAEYTDATKSKISVEALTTFVSEHKGIDYRLSFVLLEDGVKGYTQANNYAGGSVEMGGFEKLGNPNNDRTSPISDILYPLSVFVCRGYELGYELCLLGAKRCTLRQTQGNKKSPTNH
jgi:hypothetical protein